MLNTIGLAAPVPVRSMLSPTVGLPVIRPDESKSSVPVPAMAFTPLLSGLSAKNRHVVPEPPCLLTSVIRRLMVSGVPSESYATKLVITLSPSADFGVVSVNGLVDVPPALTNATLAVFTSNELLVPMLPTMEIAPVTGFKAAPGVSPSGFVPAPVLMFSVLFRNVR